MTEATKKATAKPADRRPAPRFIGDPVFEICADRPTEIITARGLNVPPTREERPLTAAVKATLQSGGSVQTPYDKPQHDRLMQRFKGIEGRDKSIRFEYSYVLGADGKPEKVRYWCSRRVPVAVPPSPPTPPKEPLIAGVNCE